jgi:hypothetical protein
MNKQTKTPPKFANEAQERTFWEANGKRPAVAP